MEELRQRWLPPRVERGAGADVSHALGIHPLVADILHARGYRDAEQAGGFLRPALADLSPPESQKDLAFGADRVADAVSEREPITVYGDYDVDGQCGTALLVSFLRDVGAQVDSYTPDRMTEGYGLSLTGIEQVASRGTGLLITVDCGISSHAEIARARALGMDVVICDHHQVPETLPEANACLNPMREDCGFAERLPCATGVAFNLICGVRRTLRDRGWFSGERGEPNLKAFLDLVALATVADVVPLRGYNRIVVRHGLDVLGARPRPGLAALCEVVGMRPPFTAMDLAFSLAPRLNAAGRLGDAARGVRLLLAEERGDALALARELDSENEQRKDVERDILVAAIAEVESGVHRDRPALVLGREGWHPGVVGIVAARLVERYGKPTVVVGFVDGDGKGSARTVGGFDVGAAMRACEEHLVSGGGHAAAAGLALPLENLDGFRDAFCARVEATAPAAGFVPELAVDASLDLDEIDARLVDDIGRLGPLGAGNRAPLFVAHGVRVEEVRIFREQHLSCRMRRKTGSLRSIGFSKAHLAPEVGSLVDIAFHVEWNEYRGRRSVQLRLKDIKIQER